MSLLSRVADRCYWMARYLERAENTARLVNVYGSLLLDLPREAGLDWTALVGITGSEDIYAGLYPDAGTEQAIRFLIADTRNPGAMLSSIGAARENMRTTRDIVPSEAWRCVNELYVFASEPLRRGLSERRRHEVLGKVIARCQQVTGLLAGSMSHGPAYHFIRIGRNLERADMTTRVVDVAAATLLRDDADLARYDNTLWMSVLQSLSAYQMYRQFVRRRIVGGDVLDFVLKDLQFPRALAHCLVTMERSLHELPRPETPLRGVTRLKRMTAELDIGAIDAAELHAWIDATQLELGELNQLIRDTWLSLEPAA